MNEDRMQTPPQDISPDQRLPPVEPPSARFILQLFLIPASIVLIIVGVWLAFNWLAQMGNDPYAYLQALERDTTVRWQAAVNLADALRDPRNVHLRKDAAVAGRLASMLDREIDSGAMDDDALKLRIYLCNALGEFQLSTIAAPPLVKAASTERQEPEKYVRFAAVKALAVLMTDAPDFQRDAHPEVLTVLMKAADDPEPVVRSTAAFALGAFGGDEARKRLQRMVSDAYPDVRYNAATTLARLGDAAAVPVLVEMLDPIDTAGVTAEKEEGSRNYKRTAIHINALRTVIELAQHNSSADLAPIRSAIEKLRAAKPSKAVDVEAVAALESLKRS